MNMSFDFAGLFAFHMSPLELFVRGLRREHLSTEDLKAALRQNGITDVREVRVAFLESDGQFSVVKVKSRAGGDGGDAKPRVDKPVE